MTNDSSGHTPSLFVRRVPQRAVIRGTPISARRAGTGCSWSFSIDVPEIPFRPPIGHAGRASLAKPQTPGNDKEEKNGSTLIVEECAVACRLVNGNQFGVAGQFARLSSLKPISIFFAQTQRSL
jgi:hypothetical protein